MLQVAYFTSKPSKILFEVHEDGNKVWLRKNIKKETDEERNVQYVCNEAYFETGASLNEIEDNFDSYYTYASTWDYPVEPTMEERMSAVEDAVMALADFIIGG